MLPEYCTREDIRSVAGKCYVLFGDNLRMKGMSGQAAVCRGQLHCFGIPTKKLPCMDADRAFFNDREFEIINKFYIDKAIAAVPRDGTPIWVLKGIGKGSAKLDLLAPVTYKYLVDELKKIVINPEDLR